MDTIVCTLCSVEKKLSEFYKNKGMPSGYANQCKECVKERAKKRDVRLRKNPKWVEAEKKRSREKYKRLGYCEKQKEWDKKRPWSKNQEYKNLNRNLRINGLLKKGEIAHHWNYNFIKDVFILDKRLHKKLHRYLIIDNDTFCFKTIEGTLLNTRKKHKDYIEIIENLSI